MVDRFFLTISRSIENTQPGDRRSRKNGRSRYQSRNKFLSAIMVPNTTNTQARQADFRTGVSIGACPSSWARATLPCAIFAIALTAGAARAHATEVIEQAVNPKLSRAAARSIVWNDVKKLVRFAQQPAKASIIELSRQFGFNYTVDECYAVEFATDWCRYRARYPSKPAAGLSSIGFGKDKRSRQPSASMSLNVLDPRVCITAAEVEKVLGPGEWFATPFPHLPPGEPLPPLERLFAYRAIPGGGSLDVEVAYTGACMSSMEVRF